MAEFKKTNHTITPRKDDDVDFQDNQSMGGNKITNAADATLSHDYITKQQLDSHPHNYSECPHGDTDHLPEVYAYDDHGDRAPECHNENYSVDGHEHEYLIDPTGNYWQGAQTLTNGLKIKWGLTGKYLINGGSTAEYPITGNITFTTPFPTECYNISLNIQNGGDASTSAAGTLYRNAWYGACRQNTNVTAGVYSKSPANFRAQFLRVVCSRNYLDSYSTAPLGSYHALPWYYQTLISGNYTNVNADGATSGKSWFYEGNNTVRVQWFAIGK